MFSGADVYVGASPNDRIHVLKRLILRRIEVFLAGLYVYFLQCDSLCTVAVQILLRTQ
jgi:hypothetical protein